MQKCLVFSVRLRTFASWMPQVASPENMEQITVEMKPKGLEMTANREQVALALKTWRLRQGLTQKQVGDMWGMSRWTILRIEAAQPCSWMMCYRIFAKLSEELEKERRAKV